MNIFVPTGSLEADISVGFPWHFTHCLTDLNFTGTCTGTVNVNLSKMSQQLNATTTWLELYYCPQIGSCICHISKHLIWGNIPTSCTAYIKLKTNVQVCMTQIEKWGSIRTYRKGVGHVYSVKGSNWLLSVILHQLKFPVLFNYLNKHETILKHQ